jgi:ketosteroid isomerase-like protein
MRGRPARRCVFKSKNMTKLTAALTTTLLLLAVSISASPEQDVRSAVLHYRQALVKKDLSALEQIWTDDYISINAHGVIRTKAERLADLKSGVTAVESIKHEGEIAVKIHGDVAIVTSQITLVGRYNGKEVAGDFRSTHIWKNDKGQWRLLMNQLTGIAKD